LLKSNTVLVITISSCAAHSTVSGSNGKPSLCSVNSSSQLLSILLQRSPARKGRRRPKEFIPTEYVYHQPVGKPHRHIIEA
ncbi:hypothetical protein PCANC_08863, partial [Puccinia coronata f. sp. avenae]